MTTIVVIPSRHLWAGVAAATLLATLGNQASFRPSGLTEYVVIHGLPPGQVASGILAAWGKLQDMKSSKRDCKVGGSSLNNYWPEHPLTKVPGFHKKYDSNYLSKVVEGLCWRGGKQISALTLADLACILAEALVTGCDSTNKPVQPLVLMRVEFYRFARVFGGSYTSTEKFDVAKTASLPAAAQALSLLAHWATIVYRGRDWSFNLALAPDAVEEISSSNFEFYFEFYRTTRGLLMTSSNSLFSPDGRPGDVPFSVAVLISSAVVAHMAEKGRMVNPDALIAARFSYGKRVTLQWASPIPAASLARILDEVRLQSGISIYTKLRSILSLPAYRFKGGDDAQRVQALVRGVTEYSHYLMEYSFSLASGSKASELAYAAARVMYSVSDVLSRANNSTLRSLAKDARALGVIAAEALKLRPGIPLA